jgi:hypothetical protein
MRKLIPMLLGLVLATVAAAGDEIYRTTDDDGNVVYTNEPPHEDAEPVDLEPLTTVPPGEEIPDAGRDDAGQDERSAEQGSAPRYRSLDVVYPPRDQTVRHNGGLVPFRVKIMPEGTELAEGHKVQIVLDGEVRGSGRSQQISVSAVSRGSHEVVARIVDSNGAAITNSGPSEFYLLRKTLGEQAQ